MTGTVIRERIHSGPELEPVRRVSRQQPGEPDRRAQRSADLAPGAYADVIGERGRDAVPQRRHLLLQQLHGRAGSQISCTSQTTQVTVYVKLGFTFRGSIIEKNSSARPKFFLGCFGTSLIPIEAPYTGTLSRLTRP